VKIAKNPLDSDLLQTEAMALKRLYANDAEEKWQGYVPKLLDSFVYAANEGSRRQTNVTPLLKGFYSLDELRQMFPAGIDPRHAVWIFRRLLAALGFAHDNNVIHGAVLPRHVMILPEQHGLVLVDWCYASVADAGLTLPPIKALVNAYKNWYPEEVFDKRSPSPATDIVMAARCIVALLGGDPVAGVLPRTVPLQIRAFLRGCMQGHQSRRPQNAWLLLKEFDELLESMGAPYFPRRFLPLVLPNR
jgi:serine/threonine protein kinase